MSLDLIPHPTPDAGPEEILLKKLAQRMDKQNRRMLANLVAWAEILDALGWNVAMDLPGKDLWLSARATKWATEGTDAAMTWETINTRLATAPPARQLIATAQLHVWAEVGTAVNGGSLPTPRGELTKRETEVLAWLREGKTGPEIAVIFGCSQRTVESHVSRIYQKLGVHHRAQLVFQTDPELP